MIKHILSLAILVLISACAATGEEGTVTISGKIKNPIPQGEVALEKFEVGEAIPVMTVNSDHNGNFQMDVEVAEPGFYRINIYGQQFETLILGSEDLKVEADGDGGSNIEISGSKDMKYMAEVTNYMRDYSKVVQDFNQRYSAARKSGDVELINELTDEGMALEHAKVQKLKKMAWSYDKSLVSLLITDFFQNKEDQYYFLDSLANKLTKELPGNSQVEMFANNLQYFKPAVGMGDVAPEIELPTPGGEIRKLSELRGKYVLLDFWAGWCGPCRRENPNVVAMYNKYNDKGFEVFSVSLDRTKSRWTGAINSDGLIWDNHVSDLKYFQSAAAIDYKVNAIPFALLLDPEGKVIGKNLRGRTLQAKLASIFGE